MMPTLTKRCQHTLLLAKYNRICYILRVTVNLLRGCHREDRVNRIDFVEKLMERGQYHFTLDDVMKAFENSEDAARAVVRRLKQSGRVATPHSGFFVIVPPQYRRIGCLPPQEFIPQLMNHLGEAYYISLLSAAMFHGASHQKPQIYQVMLRENRRSIECGRVRVDFIARHDIGRVPTQSFNTARGEATVSTPEATAVDLVGYPNHSGGLNNVATVLTELSEKLRPDKLAEIGPKIAPTAWLQRLGYLLDFVGAEESSKSLAAYISDRDPRVTPLSPSHDGMKGMPRDERWRLAVNYDVEPDL